MHVVVCIKQVPEAGEGKFDPVKRRLDRQSTRNVVNPFDRRAIAMAVQLTRAHGGSSVVLTLGPPPAREVLVEALASGIDRAIHLCDPAFAGSDTLATAHALAAAIRRLPCDLVLCGKYAVDGETAQVGPQIAELLGLPQITGARRLAITTDVGSGSRIEAERESDEGFECVEAELPALVTTAERLIQPIRPEAEALARAADAAIETWKATDLELPPTITGEAGSPTVVLALRDAQVRRPPVVLHSGDVEGQARALAQLITDWRTHGGAIARHRPLPPPAGPAARDATVWVVTEHRNDRTATAATFELLGEAAWLARRLDGVTAAVVLDADPATLDALAAHGADRVWHAISPLLGHYAAEPYAAALAALLRQRPTPHAVLFSASERGREVAPRLAARLGLGLTGDCIGLVLEADGRLLQMKPALGVGVVAPIWSRTTPQLATVRPGTFPLPVAEAGRPLVLEQVPVTLEHVSTTRLCETIVETDSTWTRLEGAPAIVGVGTGIGAPEALPLIRRFAGLFDAAVGATRRVTDRGWLPRLTQIGLTGRIVAPELYVAIGVRGAANHTIGVQGARRIVALNLDPAADIFRAADVGFIGDFRPLLERTCALLESERAPAQKISGV